MSYSYRFVIVTALIVCLLSRKADEATSFLGLPDTVILNILSQLDPKDSGRVAACNQRLRGLVKALREQSEFAVVVTFDDGTTTLYDLEEYLAYEDRIPASTKYLVHQDRMHASKVANFAVLLKQYLAQTGRIPVPEVLVKNRPEDFMELVIASIPNRSAEGNLASSCTAFRIDQLIASLPPLETPAQKLVGILVELSVWNQIRNQVWNQVWDQVWHQVSAQVWDPGWAQARDQFRAQAGPPVMDEVMDQVMNHVVNHVKGPLAQYLRKYNFLEAYRNNRLTSRLKHALRALFEVYQCATFPMRHCGEFKRMQTNFADSLARKMTLEETQRVVDSIDIPATPPDPSNYFVQTELNMLRRCLGLALLPLKFVEQAYSQEL